MQGDLGAVVPVVGYTVLRAGIIGTGLLAVGQRKRLVVSSLAASIAIELYVLGWAWLSRDAS